MRQPTGSWRWSATLVLIVALIVVFFAQFAAPSTAVNEYLALSLDGIKRGFVWQLLTFQFLHGGLLHIVFNCFTLYMFGREVESILGKARFLVLYFSSGVVGGLLQILAALIAPQYFGGSVIGASAGIFGIVAAFSTLFPDQLLTMMLIPIRFKARTLLYLSIALAIWGMVAAVWFPPALGQKFRVAGAAHLGGILVGILWIKFGWHRDYVQLPWEGWFRKSKRRSRKSELIRATSIRIPGVSKTDDSDLPQEEFISREVDPILDKISQHGIQSLTERERKILESARNKMAKR
jgi:membrane associated rhomboid family serine protease